MHSKVRQLVRSIVILALLSCTAAAADKAAPILIGAVAIRDHAGRSLGFEALNSRLVSLLRSAGFQAIPLAYQPAADVDHAARKADISHILYTDIVDIRKSSGAAVSDAMRSQPNKKDQWLAEVEFRLFALDQVLPLMTGSVNGKNVKKPAGTPATPAVISVAEPNLLTEATPQEETGRVKKHKSVAVATALEREVKQVKEFLRNPKPPAADQ